MQSNSSLSSIKVLDFTQAMAGPMATMSLGDLGADILKIEPLTGDQTRNWAPPYMNKMSSYFLSANRNKKSIAINLKSEEGIEIVKRLIKESDIIVENFRPGTMEKLGLSYNDVKKINNKIIYCSISGYGQTGSSSAYPGYDLTVLAYSGLLSLNAENNRPPIKFGVPIADIVSGLFSDIAILSALHYRDITGNGQYIDMSMLDANFSILTHQALNYLSTGKNPEHLGSAHPSIAPYQVFKTSDGYIAVAAGTEKLWNIFCKAIKRPDLIDNQLFSDNTMRVRNRELLADEINKEFSNFNTGTILNLLQGVGIPASPVNTVEDAINSEEIKQRDMVLNLNSSYGEIKILGTPFKLSLTPGSVRLYPPMLGEHTHEILKKLNYSGEEISELMKEGIINNDIKSDYVEK